MLTGWHMLSPLYNVHVCYVTCVHCTFALWLLLCHSRWYNCIAQIRSICQIILPLQSVLSHVLIHMFKFSLYTTIYVKKHLTTVYIKVCDEI